MYRAVAIVLVTCILYSCHSEDVIIPKPRMFPKIEFPERRVVSFVNEGCPYELEFPDYAQMERDSTYFDEVAPNPCWFNLHIPALNGTLHFSYYEIGGREDFDRLVEDAFKLTGKHQIKADYVEEERVQNGAGVEGFVFRVKGPSASPLQFYLTDSTAHFIRGALYFNNRVRPDSMAPVYSFVEEDVYRMIASFRWTEGSSN